MSVYLYKSNIALFKHILCYHPCHKLHISARVNSTVCSLNPIALRLTRLCAVLAVLSAKGLISSCFRINLYYKMRIEDSDLNHFQMVFVILSIIVRTIYFVFNQTRSIVI